MAGLLAHAAQWSARLGRWAAGEAEASAAPPTDTSADFALLERPLERPTARPPGGEDAFGSHALTALGQRFEPFNPDQLIAWKGAEVYRRMLRDPQVKAVFRLVCNIILSRGWRFELTEDDARQQEMREFFEWNLQQRLRGTWKQAMREVLMAKAYGYSVSEKLYASDTWQGRTRWVLDAMKGRPWNTFRFELDAHGNLTGLRQEVGGRRVELDPRKFVLHVHQPELDAVFGEGDLRAAYRAYWEKDVITKLWNIYMERMAGGFHVARPNDLGVGLSPAEKSQLQDVLKTIQGMTAAMLPAGYDLEVVHGPTTDAYERAVSQRNLEIAKSLLTPPLLGFSEQQRVGALSQSQTQWEVFLAAIEFDGDALADVLNEQVFRELARWNFGSDAFPRFRFDPYTEAQKREIAKVWGEAVQSGTVQNTLDDENRVRDLLGFDEREAEPEEADPAPAAPEPEPDSDPEADPEPPPRDTSDPPAAAASAGEGIHLRQPERPPWVARVDFAENLRRLEDGETRLAGALAAAVDGAYGEVTTRLREVHAEVTGGGQATPQDKEAADWEDALARLDGAVSGDSMRALGEAVTTHLRRAYDDGRELAQDELRQATEAAGPQLAARLRTTIACAPRLAAALPQRGPYDWSVLDFVAGVRLDTAEKYLAAKRFQIAGVLRDELLEQARTVLLSGIRDEKPLRDIVAELDSLLADVIGERDPAGRRVNIGARLNTIARTNLTDAFNQAQLAVYSDPDLGDFVQALQYTATLDSQTTDFCRSYHGRVLAKDDPKWRQITPPNHFNCRSRTIPVTAVDEPFTTDGPLGDSVQPNKGFGKEAA